MLFSMYSRILEWVNKKDLGVWLYKNKWVSFTYKQGRYVCHVSDGKGNVEWRGEHDELDPLKKDVRVYLGW